MAKAKTFKSEHYRGHKIGFMSDDSGQVMALYRGGRTLGKTKAEAFKKMKRLIG